MFICNQVVSAIVMAIAAASAVKTLALSTSSKVLVPVLTIVGVGVSFRHADISFVL